MADLAATDLTYTLRNAAFTRSDQGYRRVFDLSFGDGVLTYPAGGIPVTRANLGCPYNLLLLEFADAGTDDTGNFTWEWDADANTTGGTIRAWKGGTEASGAISATVLRCEATGY
jgi:hypothetical protein